MSILGSTILLSVDDRLSSNTTSISLSSAIARVVEDIAFLISSKKSSKKSSRKKSSRKKSSKRGGGSCKTHASKNSGYNTPPVWAIYMVGLVAKWLIDCWLNLILQVNSRMKIFLSGIQLNFR